MSEIKTSGGASPRGDDVRNRLIDNGASQLIVVSLEEDALSDSRPTSPLPSDLVRDSSPVESSDHLFCVSEKKYFWGTFTLVILTILFYISKQGMTLYLTTTLNWVQSIGFWGNVMFVLMFLLISFPVVLAGYIPLTLGAGAIYGVLLGTLTVSIASTFGACVAFWICRVSARGWLEPKLKNTNEFRFFFLLFQSKKYKMVSVLARLAPIPFGLQNSFFALTDISFKEYFLSTWIGLLPFQVVWTHLGTTLRNLQKIGTGEFELDFWQRLSLLVQLVVAILLLLYFVVLSRKMKEMSQTNLHESGTTDSEVRDLETGLVLLN